MIQTAQAIAESWALKPEFEVPRLESRYVATSAYTALQRAARLYPRKTGLIYFLDGHCHDPDALPWRAQVKSALSVLKYGRAIAKPYEHFQYGEMLRAVTKIARLLKALDVGRSDVVSLLLPNLPETMFCMWASETVGIVNPVNPLLESEIIASIFKAARTKVLITVGDLPGSDLYRKVEQIRAQLPDLRHVIVVRGKGSADCLDLHAGMKRQSDVELPPSDLPCLDDVATLFHTGGSTGLPKLVMGNHRNKVASAHMLWLTSPLTPEDAGLLVLPMFHVNAAINAFLGLIVGMKTVVAGVAGFRSAAVRENFFHILARHRITYFSAVPTIYASLLQLPAPTMSLAHVKFCISGAAALPRDVMLRFQDVTGIRLLEGYGQTEATVGTCLTPFHAQSKPGSIGRPLPYVKVKVIREDDGQLRTCGVDEIGELLTCGDHVTLGYLNPADDAKLWLDDENGTRWLKTGDLARIDRDGYVWLTGRSKELIIRGGHNIDPKMIEDAMRLHPHVLDAAAVGQPHARLGEMPVVYVRVTATEISEDALLAHAKQRIPERAAWPSHVRIVQELPLTAIGKVFKPRLIEQERDFVFSQALVDLRPRLILGRIQTRADAMHGSLSVFTLSPKPGESAELIRQHVDGFMGPFPVKYRIDIH